MRTATAPGTPSSALCTGFGRVRLTSSAAPSLSASAVTPALSSSAVNFCGTITSSTSPSAFMSSALSQVLRFSSISASTSSGVLPVLRP